MNTKNKILSLAAVSASIVSLGFASVAPFYGLEDDARIKAAEYLKPNGPAGQVSGGEETAQTIMTEAGLTIQNILDCVVVKDGQVKGINMNGLNDTQKQALKDILLDSGIYYGNNADGTFEFYVGETGAPTQIISQSKFVEMVTTLFNEYYKQPQNNTTTGDGFQTGGTSSTSTTTEKKSEPLTKDIKIVQNYKLDKTDEKTLIDCKKLVESIIGKPGEAVILNVPNANWEIDSSDINSGIVNPIFNPGIVTTTPDKAEIYIPTEYKKPGVIVIDFLQPQNIEFPFVGAKVQVNVGKANAGKKFKVVSLLGAKTAPVIDGQMQEIVIEVDADGNIPSINMGAQALDYVLIPV